MSTEMVELCPGPCPHSAEIPPRVEYYLTAAGEELCERPQPLLEWAEKHDSQE